MRIYRYESRLKFMLFRVQFWDKFEQLRRSLSVVLSASNALRNSESFKDLLHLILLLGNYMNASSIQGGAFGMKIDSINKVLRQEIIILQFNIDLFPLSLRTRKLLMRQS